MLSGLIRNAIEHRLIAVVLALVALAAGIQATRQLSVDAFPDVTSIQVQVATEVPGRSPDEVERMVTVPVEIGMITEHKADTTRKLIGPPRTRNDASASSATLSIDWVGFGGPGVFSSQQPQVPAGTAWPCAPGVPSNTVRQN
mgnify:CR=1 FL=1